MEEILDIEPDILYNVEFLAMRVHSSLINTR